ncbi:MAG: hypothetical protein RMA76_01220 [Deltaproteobacteria bacterium]|jgi:hypothetical protein
MLLRSVLTIVAATGAGALAALAVVELRAPTTPAPREVRVTERVEVTHDVVRDDPRVGPLIARSRDVEARLEALESAPAVEARDAVRREDDARSHAARVRLQADHEASHVDGTWASATRYAIEETLDGRTKARLETVDCRSDSCAARVAYDSEADALDDAMALVVADYGVPCNKQFWVEGPTVELWLYGCE